MLLVRTLFIQRTPSASQKPTCSVNPGLPTWGQHRILAPNQMTMSCSQQGNAAKAMFGKGPHLQHVRIIEATWASKF